MSSAADSTRTSSSTRRTNTFLSPSCFLTSTLCSAKGPTCSHHVCSALFLEVLMARISPLRKCWNVAKPTSAATSLRSFVTRKVILESLPINGCFVGGGVGLQKKCVMSSSSTAKHACKGSWAGTLRTRARSGMATGFFVAITRMFSRCTWGYQTSFTPPSPSPVKTNALKAQSSVCSFTVAGHHCPLPPCAGLTSKNFGFPMPLMVPRKGYLHKKSCFKWAFGGPAPFTMFMLTLLFSLPGKTCSPSHSTATS
mmetsp:Transcript_24329/g.69390  ORF Transcript_24329/g.69390 Transcript_24329/m.69390 type:complete len:254 (-) Transcript_24329:252-1013(-)